MFIEIPAKVIPGTVNNIASFANWPYNNGGDDLYWSGGVSPRPYRWQINVSITEQHHSSFRTRKPYFFNAHDVAVGDYIADTNRGIALKIIQIVEKTDTELVCVVEDVLRYNTFRDPTGLGGGIFDTNSPIIIFELNGEGEPVFDPAPSGVSGSVIANLQSRFSNFASNYNFLIEQVAHGFRIGDVIAADPGTNSFVLANAAYPYVIGSVSNIDLGPDVFMLNPFQKVVEGYDSLIGEVGDVIYADPVNAGEYSLNGSVPVMIKIRQESNSYVIGHTLSPGANTVVGSSLNINGVSVEIGNSGSVADFIEAVNEKTANTGVSASFVELPTAASTQAELLNNYGIPVIQVPSSATINGVTVNFTTTTSGAVSLGDGYADQFDMAADINAAAIPNITATANGSGVTLTNTASGPITIVNVGTDVLGNPFAGASSSSGLPLSTSTGSTYIRLDAVDARAINLYDTNGSPSVDFGLFSAENGTKAAALIIEQGVRQAAMYVVTNIAARDALNALVGDQCFVQNKGNGEWGHYIYTLSNTWVKLVDEDASKSDAQSVEVSINTISAASGLIHTVSDGSRVSFVTIHVVEPFDAPATLTVGDDDQPDRLMTEDQNDLTTVSDYSTTPAFSYSTGGDTQIKYYLNTAGATQGQAIVAITYT